MSILRLWLLTALVSLSWLLAFGQTLPLRHYTIADGLPQSTVYALCQDQQGQLWAGTQSGATWFDGQQFHTLDRQHGLAETQVTALATSTTGAVWIGHRYGGVSVYRQGKVTVVRARGFGPRGRVRQLLPARGDSTLWVATMQEGLYRLRWRGPDTLVQHYAAPAALPADSINHLSLGPRGQLWVATTAGLAIFDAATGRSISVAALPPELTQQPVNYVCRVSDALFWVATNSGLVRLSRQGQGRWQMRRYDLADGLCTSRAMRVLQDRRGRVWVLTNEGVSRAEARGEQLRFTCFEDNSQMRDIASDVLEDREGNIWLVQDDGLAQHQPDERFMLFTRRDGLPDNMVLAMTQISRNEYWICTKNGLCIYRPQAPVGQRFQPGHQRPGGAAANFVRCLLRDSQGRIWVGSRNGGAAYYTPATSRWHELDYVPGVAKQHILGLAEDRRGRIWIATAGAGATVLNPTTGEAHTFGADSGLGAARVWTALRDHRGRLWLGTDDQGLVLVDTDHDTFRRVDGRVGRLSINSMSEDAAGNLWLSSMGEGLLRFDGRRLHSYGPESGLRFNTPYFVRCDPQGHVWIGTNLGLDDFNPATGRTTSYGLHEGFLGQETNLNAVLLDSAGRLWAGTVKGLMCHDARRAQTNRMPPLTRLTGLRVALKDTVLRQGMVLPHHRNQLTFRYVGVSLTNPAQVRYQYRLVGFETAWHPPTANAEATYTNLPPGAYRFEVRACNNHGLWNARPATFSIGIEPAWWQTWWFRLLLTLVIIGVLWLAYRVHINQLLALERVRHHIARDLHDDMGSTLSSISILSQVARNHQRQQRPEQVATLLEQIGDSSRRMLDAMDDIVWAINPDHDALEDVTARMRGFASEVLESRGIDFAFRVEPTVHGLKLGMEARREFFLLFKEAINNLAKYAQCQHARIELGYQQNQLRLTVQDDGVGFDPASPAQGGGNGLTNMRSRAAALAGQLTIDTAPGQGTTLKLCIPLAE